MTDTVRERIVKHVVNLLVDMDKLEPIEDPYGVQFSEVYRDPPAAMTVGKAAVGVVLDVTEQKTALNHPLIEVTMPLDIEVHLLRDKNVVAGETVNRYLGAIERVLRVDPTLGGLCWDVLITGNEKTPTEGPYEDYVSGVMRCTIKFRHHADDPRRQI